MYTLNQIKKVLSDIATAHKQINSFGFGDIWEYTLETQVHPVMWAELKDSSFNLDGKEFDIVLSLYFMDLVNKDERNETEVLSDQLSIASDVLSTLNNIVYQDYFYVNSGVSITPFTESTDNEVSGWKCDVTLRQTDLQAL